MKKSAVKYAAIAWLFSSSLTGIAGEVGGDDRVEQSVKEELERMVTLFESSEAISFQAISISEDVSSSLQKLQYDTTLEGAIQKPNKLVLKKTGAEHAILWFDGTTATILDSKENKYARIPIEGNFEGLIKKLDALGVETPFAGLFNRELLKHVEDHVFKADFYGDTLVDSTKTNHMAFRQDAIDWQLWTVAATGAPKKIVITSKMLAGAPQHMLLIKNLSTDPLPKSTFQVQLPAEAVEVPVQSDDAERILDGSW